jgi:hypothetical protein
MFLVSCIRILSTAPHITSSDRHHHIIALLVALRFSRSRSKLYLYSPRSLLVGFRCASCPVWLVSFALGWLVLTVPASWALGFGSSGPLLRVPHPRIRAGRSPESSAPIFSWILGEQTSRSRLWVSHHFLARMIAGDWPVGTNPQLWKLGPRTSFHRSFSKSRSRVLVTR